MGPCSVESTSQEGSQAPGGTVAIETRRALKPEGLPRGWRLTRTSDITAVLRCGRRRRTPRMDIVWHGNEFGHPRLGVVVPLFGRSSVHRNRLRRRLREIARRLILPAIPAVDVVVRSRREAYEATFPALRSDLTRWANSLSS